MSSLVTPTQFAVSRVKVPRNPDDPRTVPSATRLPSCARSDRAATRGQDAVSTSTVSTGPGRQIAALQRSRLLPDYIEQGLALLMANHVQGPFQRRRHLRGILDPLSVAAGRLADQLILERLGQRRNREVVGLHRVAIGVGAPGGALYGVPDAVVPHDG